MVTAGQTATFIVVASGTAPLSYQWMKGGASILGATSSNYTTPATASRIHNSYCKKQPKQNHAQTIHDHVPVSECVPRPTAS